MLLVLEDADAHVLDVVRLARVVADLPRMWLVMMLIVEVSR